MLFGANIASSTAEDRSIERRNFLKTTIEAFQSCFPSVTIRLLEQVAAVNAQASCFGGEAIVDVFGGFAFHPEVGADAFKFMLLHEMGHHLGAGPRMTPGSKLACDCAADSWAILEGLASIARHNVELDVALAIKQLEKALYGSLNSLEATQFRDEKCWCFDWPRRKHLLCAADIPTIEHCSMFEGQNATSNLGGENGRASS
jgi:hypothetical protein